MHRQELKSLLIMNRIGLTWPNALPVTVYAQILLSASPEEDCCVPVATMNSESDRIFSGIRPRPGAIFILRRKWWENKTTRKGQARGRLEDGVYGGWNMSSSTHPAVRSVVGDPESRKLLVDYLSRRKCDDPDMETDHDGYHSDTMIISAGLKRHEIFLVPSGYDASLAPAERQPLPSVCLIHYVQDDVAPDPRVMLPHPPIMMLRMSDGRGVPHSGAPDKAGPDGSGVNSLAAASGQGGPAGGSGSPPLATLFNPFDVAGSQRLMTQAPERPQYTPAARPSNSHNPAVPGCTAYDCLCPAAEVDGSSFLAPAVGQTHGGLQPPPHSSADGGPQLATTIAHHPTTYFFATLAQAQFQVQQWPLSCCSAPSQYSAIAPGRQQSELPAGMDTAPAARDHSPQPPQRSEGSPPSVRAAPGWMLPAAKRQRNAIPSGPKDFVNLPAFEPPVVHWRQELSQTDVEHTVTLTSSSNSVISQDQIDQAITQVLVGSTGSTSSRAECGLRYVDALQADFLDTDDLLDSFADACASPVKPVQSLV